MSLTEFLKNSDVRERMNDDFPNQGERASGSIKSEWQTRNYMLIGTAYDYLLRFWMRRNITTVHTRPWVAETSLEIAKEEYPTTAPEIEETIQAAKEARDSYLDTGELSRGLVEAAIDLARIDGIARSGELPTSLGEYDDGDIVDCIKLIKVLDESSALDGEEAYLNPTFGLASNIVGGADADAIVDGTLIDVKTTGKSTFKAEYWRQLVGYLTLTDIHQTLHDAGVYAMIENAGGREHQTLPEIDEFAVYFSRHGELSTVPATTVYEADGYSEFRSWFFQTAMEEYAPFDGRLDTVLFPLFS